ncbi:unnamed protein product [Owenia fusiformis]|uniref:Cytochrome b5 reductase 4 n=1 Tax=Owenia fusiformis TaxID=6347 RepID=A0A8J1TB73_OWEFU|nr:unnamed protein product [Owenia fusiformis]
MLPGGGLSVPTQLPGAGTGNLTVGTSNATGSGRNKFALKPGRSLMDWIKLGKSGKDLTGVGGVRRQEVSIEDLKQHNKVDDAWISVRGRVYNVTPYMEFHPGGLDELMRGAGIDATRLFDEIHRWVNIESMLAPCLIGKLQETRPVKSVKKSPPSLAGNLNGLAPPVPQNVRKATEAETPTKPRYDWLQTDSEIHIEVYTKHPSIQHEDVIIDYSGSEFLVTMTLLDLIFTIHLDLENKLEYEYKVKTYPNGKCQLILRKSEQGIHWPTLGRPLMQHQSLVKSVEKKRNYRSCELIERCDVSHDTLLLGFQLPQGCRMCVPVGHHVYIRRNIQGTEVVRSYTVVLPSLVSTEQDTRLLEGRVFYLMVKVYLDGAMTPHIGNLNIGDTLEISNSDGNFLEKKLDSFTNLVLLAAGTGFTPMIKLINKTVSNKHKSIKDTKLMFFNKTEKDILWHEQLNELEAANERFAVSHVLSQAGSDWSGLTGRVSLDLLKQCTSQQNINNTLVCVCGPIAFTNQTIRLLKDIGYGDTQLHAFLG